MFNSDSKDEFIRCSSGNGFIVAGPMKTRRWANPKTIAVFKHGNVGHKKHARLQGITGQIFANVVEFSPEHNITIIFPI